LDFARGGELAQSRLLFGGQTEHEEKINGGVGNSPRFQK
jgi:hypothetical protein